MKKFLYLFLISSTFLCACSGKNAKEDKDKARNEYRQALKDSIDVIKFDIDSCENQLQIMSDNVNNMIRDFTVVNNAREVEGYYIFQGWQNRYPLQSTGLVARISNGESLELIAAYKGATFNSITVESGQHSASSALVPYDQAINYRNGDLNTVMFSGPEADAVAELIANNDLNNISVIFKENNTVKGKWQIPSDYKKMVTATWLLYSARKQQISLEGALRMYNAKINILRTHLDKENGPISEKPVQNPEQSE